VSEHKTAGLTLGVGDGAGNLFVNGSYESIAAVREKLAERQHLLRKCGDLIRALAYVTGRTCEAVEENPITLAKQARADFDEVLRERDRLLFTPNRDHELAWRDVEITRLTARVRDLAAQIAGEHEHDE
jgi:hypothetical protein